MAMKDSNWTSRGAAARGQGGFSLVELMVALVLGLLLVLAASNLFITNKQTYRTVENLSRVQESLRFAFDLLARDARMAGAIPCGVTDKVANVLNGSEGEPWGETGVKGIAGATGTDADIDFLGATIAHCDTTPSAGCRVDDTAALRLSHAAGTQVEAKITSHVPPSATMTLDNTDGISDADILMVCKPGRAAIFQVTDLDTTASKVIHNEGNSESPGNCTKCLNYPVDCGLAAASCTDFTDGQISKLTSQLWYIGSNGRGSTSLYRKENTGPTEEIVPDVSDIGLAFLTESGTDYEGIGSIADWNDVRAMQVTLTAVSPDAVGTDGNPLTRDYTFTVSLRNRLK